MSIIDIYFTIFSYYKIFPVGLIRPQVVYIGQFIWGCVFYSPYFQPDKLYAHQNCCNSTNKHIYIYIFNLLTVCTESNNLEISVVIKFKCFVVQSTCY